jgi:hypothetical protein
MDDRQSVVARVQGAYAAFRNHDQELLRIGAAERSIAFHIARHLIELFPAHNVDVEYNKHGVDPKRVHWDSDCRVAAEPLICPDIVIHRRRTNEANLLVVEIKRDGASERTVACDRQKLAVIRDQYRYRFSLLLIVPSSDSPEADALYEWEGEL